MIHILSFSSSPFSEFMIEVTCSVDNSIVEVSTVSELIFVVTLVNVILWKGINESKLSENISISVLSEEPVIFGVEIV